MFIVVLYGARKLKKKMPLNMQIPKQSLKAFNSLFTFEHKDAG